ncbi:hypothetical protein QBC46DRAFT_349408 [Diplogelasinospora grovesii]|uniref:G-patch domain-containing protein n=1 Tax=Diplogelasinospora grovesii TaxID=303347 RepID=A0AAN6NL07_9PEZI|nr:hypothetical protein QBC46DRAFT_349408 [Diplogelasinospora grovesii]
MSYKRSRATYEADLSAQQSPYVLFGTPLLPLDPDVRDDGSYVPVWKQEVRDERGRKRLHGAFTGGWSAGYFNTVGSKEGWTPSTFVSSRTNRRKDDAKATLQRPEDFMDEEDLAEAEEAKKIQTTSDFAGLGSTEDDVSRINSLMGLFRVDGETMGTKLLKKMGWREGQGIGPKVRRKARLEMRNDAGNDSDTFLFAPENVSMISFTRKTDHKGLGFEGETRLNPMSRSGTRSLGHSDDEEDDEDIGSLGQPKLSLVMGAKKKGAAKRGGIGTGVLNDNGSDDEDPYEIGPRIKYNRVIGGNKKKKKASVTPINPSLKNKPTFIPRKSALGKVGLGVRKCHDGRLPLDGFVFGSQDDPLIAAVNSEGKYAPPEVPPDWRSSKQSKSQVESSNYVSTADAAKTSTLDPKSRAELLGEKQLPGKSVFDFMSAAARDRLAAVTGKADLPPARGEIPAGYNVSEEERLRKVLSQVPRLDKETAVAAISRGVGGGAPYAEDEEKRSRYRAYLEHQAGFRESLPPKPSKMTAEEWLRESYEFFNCARIFKPMTGLMASRFTTSSSSTGAKTGEKDLVTKPPPKPADPAEEAAKLGMFGHMTRSVADFYPTRLLCKRFNVKPPAHVQPDNDTGSGRAQQRDSSRFDIYGEFASSRQEPMAALEYGIDLDTVGGTSTVGQPAQMEAAEKAVVEKVVIDSSKNEALEGTRAGEEVFRAIFGDKASSSSAPGHFLPLPPKRRSVEEEFIITEPPSEEACVTVDKERLIRFTAEVNAEISFAAAVAAEATAEASGQRSPPPQYPYPASEASGSSSAYRAAPPPFSSLFTSLLTSEEAAASILEPSYEQYKHAVVDHAQDEDDEAVSTFSAPAYAPTAEQLDQGFPESSNSAAAAASQFRDETKRALPQDTKGQSSSSKDDDAEPPPAYSEGSSPLQSFTYLMAAAGGASSIITQVQQGGPPINTIGDVGADETITMDLRGTRFTLSRDELLTLPEFVLLSLFPNGLFPEGHMGGFSEGDAVQVDYDPASLQYMLDFFRNVAQSIPTEASASASQDGDSVVPLEPGARDDSSKRAGIIVLREDLDFYAIPHKKDIDQAEMIEVKRAAARALLKQDGIFSGLKRSDEPGTTEAHLIEMLTAGGFNHDDRWGHRAGEPNKAVVCSLALARLRSDIRGNEMGSNAVGMAQKLLLFWRKPARRCWWEGVELDNVEGVEGKLKVWIRRVWTLEMSVIGLR